MVDLRLHDAGDLAVALGAAPDVTFGPERMLPQFLDRRMIVIGDEVGKRKVGRVEDARFAAEKLEQRSEEHTSELQSLMRISYAVFGLKKKKKDRKEDKE